MRGGNDDCHLGLEKDSRPNFHSIHDNSLRNYVNNFLGKLSHHPRPKAGRLIPTSLIYFNTFEDYWGELDDDWNDGEG
jgi:hypothetical protein